MQLPAQWQAGIDRNTEVLRGHAQLLASFNAPRPASPDTTTSRGQIASIVGSTRSQPAQAARRATQTLGRINQANDGLHAITRLLPARAAADAARVQAALAGGSDGGALAGVPFVVKDLFDVAGQVTTAGAALRAQSAPATRDAAVVQRLSDAGAVLVGTANMDEFAYGFATVNEHYGTTANPHDHRHLAGGSSGGSAAAVAAGWVPFALGSDTNGSIRVPAALCGVYGLRPTHGTLPLEGVFPFVDALDVVGPFATSVADLRRVYEVMHGHPVPACSVETLRIAQLGGWFQRNLDPELEAGLGTLLTAIGSTTIMELPDAERARAAAFVLTAAEGGHRHRNALSTQAAQFDPATRDRLLAGLQLPASAVADAQQFAHWFARAMRMLWDRVDVLIAPATPGVAPRIDQESIIIDGLPVSARANLGIFTQPLGLAACPVLAAPLPRPGRLPLGVQLIAAPGREDRLFALAAQLERDGLLAFSAPAETR
ncbi:AtzE family amidohydrolase [Xanthomonas campestris pv. raphani]|uniref:AtzE family amidohydrolase n=1 Tax=Xanthomonas campestris TaxID=339 RepID=UPI002B2383F5|nr:AtzE family amidohydrolase [Xanthomonas campestris]MEB2181788.1 AtzE family amidohydrolase [Xanthomonas campestris pv. campestris]MEA9654618.1 AtzE family amidohydrolase [Xanthomonas campestris pv. raphani]MEA9765533.1 AtzE family amidohydrolase [Xanthomonas campestris pv. raphani]MEA9816477.1 AtzE family amidohydrolase [Xanthomonas campestris pv. raphani]MEA9908545.1 AtzE family amidohydrolase [Xanthomonas campestris pv. raphani]